LAGRPVLAVSGIGRPDAFAATLRDLGADVRAALTFPDHYAYRAEETARRLAAFPPDLLPVTTEKDAMKLRECLSDEAKARMFAVGVEMRVSGLPELRQRLEMVCEGH
ncbi:MAG: tetraacyldisaccharide 4'-kinase, partial [Planctomycetes bacterium]|nr:tetraacyldisaccharide 4'-kinase [Planctomycetota bacterium]